MVCVRRHIMSGNIVAQGTRLGWNFNKFNVSRSRSRVSPTLRLLHHSHHPLPLPRPTIAGCDCDCVGVTFDVD